MTSAMRRLTHKRRAALAKPAGEHEPIGVGVLANYAPSAELDREWPLPIEPADDEPDEPDDES